MTQREKKQVLYSVSNLLARSVDRDCACAEPQIPYSFAKDNLFLDRDCACAGAPLSSSTTTAVTWRYLPSAFQSALEDGYTVHYNPAAHGAVAVLGPEARARLVEFATPRPLLTALDDQLAQAGVLVPVDVPLPKAETTQLTAWLHLTERCNLACTYCYVRQSPATMSTITARAVVDAVFRAASTHGYRQVKLKYAGGEPTLVWPLVTQTHAYAETLAAQQGITLRATVLSNGTMLTPEVVEWLLAHRVRLMVSLDGVGEVHDTQRHTRTGQGSFAAIARSLDLALAYGVKPHISVTVTATNVSHLAPLIEYVVQRDLTFHLNLSRSPRDVTGLSDPQEQARWVSGLQEAIAVAVAHSPERRIMDTLLDLIALDAPHDVSCGAGRHYLAFTQSGQVAACQMQLEKTIGDVRESDPLARVRQSFANPTVDEKAACRTCPWRYVCGGGCPLLPQAVYGSADHASPYCFLYRALLPELIVLEGKRLLALLD